MLIAMIASVVAISRMMNGRLPAIDLIDAHSLERSSVENSARSRRPVYASIAPPATTTAQHAERRELCTFVVVESELGHQRAVCRLVNLPRREHQEVEAEEP